MPMRNWEASYKGHTIRVQVQSRFWHLAGELLVDGQVKDKSSGLAIKSRLEGELATDGQSQKVVVRLGGLWRVNCHLQVAGASVALREM